METPTGHTQLENSLLLTSLLNRFDSGFRDCGSGDLEQEPHLEKFLVLPNGEEIVRYLRSLRMVHEISVSRALPSSYPVVMAEFREAFEVVFRLRYANWTPKVHIVYSHFEVTYEKYF